MIAMAARHGISPLSKKLFMTNILKKKWSNFLVNDFALFRLINAVTTDNHCAYYLVGAKARDLLFEHFGCTRIQRATLDTDVAICCKNWQEYEKSGCRKLD